MMVLRRISVLLACVLMGVGPSALAQTFYANGTGSTFEIRFNTGYTSERGAMIAEAASWWADRLASDVTIVLEVSFVTQTAQGQDMPCLENEALLGLGGTTTLFANSPGAPRDVAHPQALANAFAGYDLDPTTIDARLQFNAKLDDDTNFPDCIGGGDWYYGFGSPPDSRDVSFYHTALHELAHGLGFQSYANFETGELFAFTGYPQGINDAFLLRLRHVREGLFWSLALGAMTDEQRAAAARDDGDLVWEGDRVNALAGILSDGTQLGRVKMYAPQTFNAGASVSHFDASLVPDELMEPRTAATFDARLAEAALHDIGWGAVGRVTLPPLEVGDSGGGAVLWVTVLLVLLTRRRQRQ